MSLQCLVIGVGKMCTFYSSHDGIQHMIVGSMFPRIQAGSTYVISPRSCFTLLLRTSYHIGDTCPTLLGVSSTRILQYTSNSCVVESFLLGRRYNNEKGQNGSSRFASHGRSYSNSLVPRMVDTSGRDRQRHRGVSTFIVGAVVKPRLPNELRGCFRQAQAYYTRREEGPACGGTRARRAKEWDQLDVRVGIRSHYPLLCLFATSLWASQLPCGIIR